MSLIADSRLGLYEIVSPLGTGGMGEVYRARDTKLGRDVALKILPETFTGDAETIGNIRGVLGLTERPFSVPISPFPLRQTTTCRPTTRCSSPMR